MTVVRTLLILLVVATTARADVWKRAIDPSPGIDIYEVLMTKGDEATIAANARSINRDTIIKNIGIAIDAYRGAAKALPKSAEPYFRIASVLHSFFFDCVPPNSPQLPKTCHGKVQLDQRAKELLEAWDTFEALAPLDPRVNEILVSRALTRTKLVASTPKPKSLLEAAARDYEAVLDREDGLLLRHGRLLVLGNLAETHMMLGNVDQALEVFEDAIRNGGRTSTVYGYAVALDRNEQGARAINAIRGQGIKAFEDFKEEFNEGAVFYVPAGEEHYYFALVNEAFGNDDDAITHWRGFLRSGAHPQFHPNAKAHLDKLMARKSLKFRVPITPDLEEPRLRNPRLRK